MNVSRVAFTAGQVNQQLQTNKQQDLNSKQLDEHISLKEASAHLKEVCKNAKNEEPITLREAFAQEGINLPKPTPLQSGLLNGFVWALTGFLLDRGLGKMFKAMKTPLKTALLINGGIGLISGGMTYIRERKAAIEEKQPPQNNSQK